MENLERKLSLKEKAFVAGVIGLYASAAAANFILQESKRFFIYEPLSLLGFGYRKVTPDDDPDANFSYYTRE